MTGEMDYIESTAAVKRRKRLGPGTEEGRKLLSMAGTGAGLEGDARFDCLAPGKRCKRAKTGRAQGFGKQIENPTFGVK